jgi:hypothetical protein
LSDDATEAADVDPVAMVSHPDDVLQLIETAAEAVQAGD